MTEDNRIKLLLVEDDRVDRMAFERFVAGERFPYDCTIAGSVSEAAEALGSETFDVAIVDYRLGDGTAFDLFGPLGEVPFIVVTGSGEEEIAVRAMKSGAFDYLVKDADRAYLSVLPKTVENAIRRSRMDKALRESEEKFRVLAEKSPNMIFINKRGRVVYANEKCVEVMGYTREEFLSPEFNFLTLIAPESMELVRNAFGRQMKGEDVPPFEYAIVTKQGARLEVIITSKLIDIGGETAILGIITDITERKQAEDALKQSEERTRAIMNTANDAIICIQPDDIIYLWNKKAEEMFGYPASEAVGKGARQLLVPEKYRESMAQGLKTFLRTGEGPVIGKTVELTALNKAGAEFPVEFSLSGMKIREQWHATAIIRDITRRKQAETEIQHNHDIQTATNYLLSLSLEDVSLENILERALENILSVSWLVLQRRGGIFLVDDDSGELVMKVNNGLSERIQKICSRVPFGRCLCGRAAATSKLQFAARIDERHEVNYEGIIPHGHYCIPILFAGKTLGVLNLYLQEGHPRIQKEEEFLTAIANTLAGIIVRKQGEETIRQYQHHLEELVRERTRALETEVAQHKLAGEEIRKLNDDLNQHIAELEEARILADAGIKARGAFLANISHELITPLNSIIGFSQILLDGLGGPMNEQQKDYAASILQGGNRLHETLKEIVQFAGLESGEMQLHADRFLLKDLLKSSLLAFNEKAAVQGVNLSLETGLPPETEIEADRVKLHQALFNLLDNAVKFTPAGGNVRVSARLSAEFPIDSGQVSMRNAELKEANHSELHTPNSALHGNFIEVSVSDTGIGIKEEDMSRLFQTFQQLESPYTKQYKGTGLGLMLAKKIVELHGGRIWVESVIGKGSTFTFAIPVGQGESSES
ncbi:MAG: PAS domain S-box protein [Nitrospirota bacterium]